MRTVSRWSTALDASTFAVVGALVGVTAALYDSLPASMPTHFDLYGRPNGWMPRAAGAWVVPVFAVVLTAFVRFSGRWVAPQWRAGYEASPIRALALITGAILAAVQALMLHAALTPEPDLGNVVWLVLGAVFVAMGALLPRTKRNPLFGVRGAYAMASDANWARAQRLGAWSLGIGGAVSLVAGLTDRPVVAIVAIGVSALVPAIGSKFLPSA